jgi:hypothetical protein
VKIVFKEAVIHGGKFAADVTFHCNTPTAIFVIFGRLPLADAIADGRVQIEGEKELATTFAQSFQGG